MYRRDMVAAHSLVVICHPLPSVDELLHAVKIFNELVGFIGRACIWPCRGEHFDGGEGHTHTLEDLLHFVVARDWVPD